MADQIAEREEKMKELDNLKSEFVSSVSHELRTPLTTIKALVRVMQRKNISEHEREEYLQTVADECDRQIEFVQNLLDLSRIESGAYKTSFATVNVVKLLGELVDEQQRAAASRGLTLKFELPENQQLPLVSTDSQGLRRIVSNLIENAMKYTPEDGTISLSARLLGERFAIAVEDDGCGIAKGDLPYVFERFYRGQPLESKARESLLNGAKCVVPDNTSGIGLGLYLVKNLVEQIQAEIRVESPVNEKGQGTRFTLLLPLYTLP